MVVYCPQRLLEYREMLVGMEPGVVPRYAKICTQVATDIAIAVALYSASSLLCSWFLHFASGWKGHSLEKELTPSLPFTRPGPGSSKWEGSGQAL